MRQAHGDLWGYLPADARCVTTNGAVLLWPSVHAVMGRGVALQARERYPGVDGVLGELIQQHGNVPHVLRRTADGTECWLVSFPVKYDDWRKPADLELIEGSARRLVSLTDVWGWQNVVLPQPGTGAGRLTWAQVEPVLSPILDDRFIVLHRAE